MTVVRWRPFPEITSVQREMNRLFDSFMQGPEDNEEYRGTWKPDVDIRETPDAVVIMAELPGMQKEDIKVTIRDNMMQLSGEKKQVSEHKDETYHRVERSYGSFCRTFSLPSLVEAEKITATFKDGVLHVRLPKAEQAKPKEISIKTE